MPEKAQWTLILLNTINTIKDFAESFSKVQEGLPKEAQQRLPGLLGLSLVDEQIFNGVLAQLTQPEQMLITGFLFKKCQNFQRNRFINVVAGMKVVEEAPAMKERAWNKNTGISTEKIISAGSKGSDRREDFLKKFAEIINTKGLDAAYKYALGSRLILKESVSDRVKEQLEKEVRGIKKVNKKIAGRPYRGFWKEFTGGK